MIRRTHLVVGAALLGMLRLAQADECKGTLYLTIDTGNMAHAEAIAATLKRQRVQATFFLANEKTLRGDHALDPSWRDFWAALAAEGNAFGSHTWRHGKWVRDNADGSVVYRPMFPATGEERLDAAAVCAELQRVDQVFQGYTGRPLDPIWRSPGGHTTANALAAAQACGYAHVGWSPAGFLGDELPSERYPNQVLVDRAVANLRSGDIILMHMGIWSRKDPLQPRLDELLTRLAARGFCFARLPATDAVRSTR
jgi:peptidoglycan/xylan/chitin deacetylase (PgdA/CDA1 family)